MADVNLENEAKNLKRADVGTEVRNAPGGDEQIYVNKQGDFSRNIKLLFSFHNNLTFRASEATFRLV